MSLLEELRQCGDWFDALTDQHERLDTLESWLQGEEQDAQILPPHGMRLNALKQTTLAAVKVVITGQDPYPGLEGNGPDAIPHAMGLSFSVPQGVKPPRSLNNIYKELHEDCGLDHPGHGDLSNWARQGVLMLNSVLTLRQGEANSHAKKGWEKFTRAVLEVVNEQAGSSVFLAWGKPAHKLASIVDETRHQVIRTSHPSPLGARKSGSDFEAFLGSRCFSRTNDYLIDRERQPIDWTAL